MRRSRGLVRSLAVVAWSVAVWCALWSQISTANVLSGAVLGVFTLLLVPQQEHDRRLRIRPVRTLRLAWFVATRVVSATLVVAWEIITPRSGVHEGVVAAPLRTDDPGLVTIIANTIGLIPGSVVIEIQRNPPESQRRLYQAHCDGEIRCILYLHVLHLRSFEQVRGQVAHLERMILDAFAPTEELAVLRAEARGGAGRGAG